MNDEQFFIIHCSSFIVFVSVYSIMYPIIPETTARPPWKEDSFLTISVQFVHFLIPNAYQFNLYIYICHEIIESLPEMMSTELPFITQLKILRL